VRKHAALALGEVAPGTSVEAISALQTVLRADHSVFARATTATSIGSVGRRASAVLQQAVPPSSSMPERQRELLAAESVLRSCVDALIECLTDARERNFRPSADVDSREEGSDMFQGGYPIPMVEARSDVPVGRFEAVRSAVRESALSSLVVLCTSYGEVLPVDTSGSSVVSGQVGRLLQALEAVVERDPNIVACGFALDAMRRLAASTPAHTAREEGVTELRTRVDAAVQAFALPPADLLDRSASWDSGV